jgi:PAS domain S-box-containing protein
MLLLKLVNHTSSNQRFALDALMKILVVEDDQTVVRTLQFLFSGYHYTVDIATDGEMGLQMVEAVEYDLLLLDVVLPKLDGVTLCQQLRSKGFQKPILLLIGQGEGRQKVNFVWSATTALNIGADDYVIKPFDPEELVARIQALLRRSSAIEQPVLTWGHLSIHPSSRRATYGSHVLTITPKEYALLELLLRTPQKALSARAILDNIWSSLESPGEAAVRVHIKELRQKLTATGAPKDFIKTVHRVGYRLNPLYCAAVLETAEQTTLPQMAELNAISEELRITVGQLRSNETEQPQNYQKLETAYQVIEQERQYLQAYRDELELRIAERTGELVTMNDSLQQQQNQWQALFENALDAIVITDDNGQFVVVNSAACRLFGTSRQDLLRLRVTNFADPALDVAQLWQGFLQQGQISGEFCLHRLDGTIRETELTAIANFVPGYHLSILRDISDRQQAEAALRKNEQLLRLAMSGAQAGSWDGDIVTGKLNWSLENYQLPEKKHLEAQFYRAQRLESLGMLTSRIAHDLNNVLTPITTISYLLQSNLPNLNEQLPEMLEVLEASAKRGTDLVKQILTFARGTIGERKPVQVASLLQEIINIIQQSFPKTIAICHTLPNPTLWQVSADPTQVHQVLMNLCVNARDAMPNGGVLTLAAENFEVDERFAQTNLDACIGRYVVLTVVDTGNGISPEVRDRIFEPLFTTKAPGQGTGLGLATVLGIIKNYGGFLQVFSEVGRGTQMKAYLPAIAEVKGMKDVGEGRAV